MAQQPGHAQTTNEPLPVPDIATMPPPSTPFFPSNPTHLSQADVERIVDSRVHIAYAAARQKERELDRNKNMARTAAIGLGGFAVGVGTTMIVGSIRRRRAAAAGGGR